MNSSDRNLCSYRPKKLNGSVGPKGPNQWNGPNRCIDQILTRPKMTQNSSITGGMQTEYE